MPPLLPHKSQKNSHSLPSTIINIRLQLPSNHRRNPLSQPHIPEQRIIAFLTQRQLTTATETEIGFAVFVEIRGQVPAAVLVVEVQDAAFADVEEETDVDAASRDEDEY